MSNFITSVEHAFAIAASDVVKAAKFFHAKVVPELQKVENSAATIEAITAVVSPDAANIERLAFAALGVLLKAVTDADAVVGAKGVNLMLDAQLVADIKAVLPALAAQAAALAPPKAA